MAAPSISLLAKLLSTGDHTETDRDMKDQAKAGAKAESAASSLTEILYASDHQQAPYQVTWISISYHRHEGLVQLPGSNVASDICRESQPYGGKRVEWAVARMRHPPNVPAPEENSNEVLLEQVVTPIAMTTMPDGMTPVFYRSGFYRYAFGEVANYQSTPLRSPKNPALSADRPSVSPGEFIAGIAPTLEDD